MLELSRLTGKDFSGPVPEIRIFPTPAEVIKHQPEAREQTPAEESEISTKNKHKRQRTKNDDGLIILGEVDQFEM